MRPGITVVIPTFPARVELLKRAIESVQAQTLVPVAMAISTDVTGEGATATRQHGLDAVTTEWTAFLDDDDEFLPWHLERLSKHAEETEADLVWSWFQTIGGHDPFPEHFGRQFDLDDPHQITITTLVRTEAAQMVGGFIFDGVDEEDPGVDAAGNRTGEDFRFSVRMAKAGFKLSGLAERTWLWHHDSGNTSGLASRRPRFVPPPNGFGPTPLHPPAGKIVGGIDLIQ